MMEHAVPQDVSPKKNKIPIRNLWHMLLYTWDRQHLINRWRAESEDSPSLDALLAAILAGLIQQRMRIGLGRGYRRFEGETASIRGRILFSESTKRLSFQRGRAVCRYEIFSANVLKNKIIKTTLERLVQLGEFGTRLEARSIRSRLRRVARQLVDVDSIEIKPEIVRRELLNRQDNDYALMLEICHLILRRQMPTEDAGDSSLPFLDRDALTLWKVYESFVAKFYKCHLVDWHIEPQKIFNWPAKSPSKYLPVMKPDLVMTHRPSGRRIVLDTKFSAHSLVQGQWGGIGFSSASLYQLYAYLRSQEHLSEHHECCEGILLYPAARYQLAERIRMHGHTLRWQTIDLSQSWENVESDLLAIPTISDHHDEITLSKT